MAASTAGIPAISSHLVGAPTCRLEQHLLQRWNPILRSQPDEAVGLRPSGMAATNLTQNRGRGDPPDWPSALPMTTILEGELQSSIWMN
ncbi:MAG: hypothetical protein WA724_09700 [Candidatus Dormiibacterota bacterium]